MVVVGQGGMADGGRLVVNCGSLGGAAMAKFEIQTIVDKGWREKVGWVG